MESKEKHADRLFYGKYRGFIRDVKDPEKKGRVRCQVPAVLGTELLTDWAWPCGAWYGGGEDYGDFKVPPVGSAVYVEFEAGDVNRPLWTAAWWGQKNKKNHVPKLARGERDETTELKGEDFFQSGDGSLHGQPESPYAGKYPDVHVLKTAHEKLVVEVDDTPGKGRFHQFHGPSRSWEELDVKGEKSVRVADRRYEEIGKNDETHVKGDRHAGVDQDDALLVRGDQFVTVFGNRRTIVFGDDIEFMLGSKVTTVVLAYARMAGISISDLAGVVTHNP